MQQWQFLKPGSKIGIISPGSAGFEAGLFAKAEQKITAAGFTPVMHPHLPNHDPFSLYAPEVRLECILRMLKSGCQALWAMRGGYGSMQLLPLLERHVAELRALAPVPLIGFSDVTVLHSFWSQQLGWPSIHGGCCVPSRMIVLMLRIMTRILSS